MSEDGLNTGPPLSSLERSIVSALQRDGRAQYARMARDLGITEKTVARRVERLLADHVIEITTATDPSLLGYRAAALIGVSCDGAVPPPEVVAAVAELRWVDYAVQAMGPYELLVEIVCRDEEEMLEVAQGQILAIPGVAAIETFPYLQMPYQEPVWERAQEKDGGFGVDASRRLDEVDRRIVAELSENGRLPFALVGEALGISESQVRKRVHRMTDSGAVRIMALTNPRNLGFETLAFIGLRAAPEQRVSDLAAAISAVPSVTYLAICAGRFDILAEVVCRDAEHLIAVLDDEFREVPGVAQLETFVSRLVHHRRLHPAPGAGP
ncbi:MAG: Lrp/AsnC family transcriptional regulator [Solirubrobacterales bacterium]